MPSTAARTAHGAMGSRHSPPPCSSCQLLVLDSMWLRCAVAVATFVVGGIFLVVAFEEHQLRVAFEGEDVRGDAIEEPAIVGDHHRATGEGQQRLFKCA